MDYVKTYKTPHVLLMWGEDFSHVNAVNTFSFMDLLI